MTDHNTSAESAESVEDVLREANDRASNWTHGAHPAVTSEYMKEVCKRIESAIARERANSSESPKVSFSGRVPASGDWIAAADVKRLVREIDVALNGETGAAKQASLCDIASQVCDLARKGGPIIPRLGVAQARGDKVYALVAGLMAQREEVLAAFVAKYGFGPDEAVQVVKGNRWWVERRDPLVNAPAGADEDLGGMTGAELAGGGS